MYKAESAPVEPEDEVEAAELRICCAPRGWPPAGGGGRPQGNAPPGSVALSKLNRVWFEGAAGAVEGPRDVCENRPVTPALLKKEKKTNLV